MRVGVVRACGSEWRVLVCLCGWFAVVTKYVHVTGNATGARKAMQLLLQCAVSSLTLLRTRLDSLVRVMSQVIYFVGYSFRFRFKLRARCNNNDAHML